VGQAVLEKQSTSYLGEQTISLREKDYSEQTAREVDLCIKSLIDHAYERAKNLLQQRRAELEQGAQLLLEKETLSPEEFPPLRTLNQPASSGSRPV
jgi:cell division protease FtsH